MDEGKPEGGDSAQAQAQHPVVPKEMEAKEISEQRENESPRENPYQGVKIDIKVYENKEANLSGYGYDILILDALYIHQPHIPAINGNRGFKTKEQAHKAAELVIYKIRNNILPEFEGGRAG